ncbi:hypothetical protein [Alienimonas californiensis]|uniref:Uncharacterized protein n=1 Tax=Alienimonas californiensis TaxID=2527989 RepID=A0A517P5R9_9PLAN|nr:hypothetical protein [Alienimonas californiensis]QDT14717.1 hypothetical protein CA12_07950 [Alienimonas californiensis]
MADDPLADDLQAEARPRWWGVTPAVVPQSWWTDWRPRRSDWAEILEPTPFDPAGPWRRAAVWLAGAPLLTIVVTYVLLVLCMRVPIEPIRSMIRAVEAIGGDAAVVTLIVLTGPAVGCRWALRRGRGSKAARRAAAVYLVGVAWLVGSVLATGAILDAMF